MAVLSPWNLILQLLPHFPGTIEILPSTKLPSMYYVRVKVYLLHYYCLTLKRRGHFFQYVILFPNVVQQKCNIFKWSCSNKLNVKSVLWILMAWCFSTRASVVTVLTRHPCVSRCLRVKLNTLRLEQNGNHFADNIFQCIILSENYHIFFKIKVAADLRHFNAHVMSWWCCLHYQLMHDGRLCREHRSCIKNRGCKLQCPGGKSLIQLKHKRPWLCN